MYDIGYYIYVDESGSDHPVHKKNIRRKDMLFVVFAAIIPRDNLPNLVRHYIGILRRSIATCSGTITLSRLFEVYEICTGKSPEIKAGYLLGLEGPFKIFSSGIEECRKLASEQLLKIAEDMLSVLMNLCDRAIAVVIDKVKLHRLSEKTGKSYDVRLCAMDFLFTRIARFLEAKGTSGIVIHDKTHRAGEIVGLLTELRIKGYFYNPRLRYRPRYELIEKIYFVDSARCPHIQYIDIAANAVLRAKSGASKELYRIIASSTKYLEIINPKS